MLHPKTSNKFFLSLLFIFSSLNIYAQDGTNSPYSRLGIGDVVAPAFAHQAGMANIGASYTRPNYINNTNPALLARTDFTIFEGGAIMGFKVLQNNNNISQQDFGGNLNYLSLAFPIRKKWTMNLGLMPYTSVRYRDQFNQNVINSNFTAFYDFQGTGGLTQLHWSNGVELFKNFFLGFKLGYVFGATTKQASATLNSGIESSRTVLVQRYRYNDLTFDAGLAYTFKLTDKYSINAGFVYGINREINATRFEALERRLLNNDLVILADTVVNNAKGTVTLPEKYTFGISLHNEYKWLVGLDVSVQNWSNFRDFGRNDSLRNSLSIGLGFEITPNIYAIDKKDFFKRATYRFGLNYIQNPIKFAGVNLDEFAVTAGVSLAFNRNVAMFNIAIRAGTRGALSLIRENYVRLNLGITINDKWFVKRKID